MYIENGCTILKKVIAINQGKIFEEDFKKSVPEYVLVHRLPDSVQSYSGGKFARFTLKNPFDFLLWDSTQRRLFALELKTVGGTIISFERSKQESKEIHYHQIEGLNKWNKYDGITAGFVIEFRKIETTYFVPIETFNSIINSTSKTSINPNDIVNSGLDYIVIPQEKKITRYNYKIEELLKIKEK